MHVVQLYTYVHRYIYLFLLPTLPQLHILYLVWNIEINWDLCDGSRLSGFMLFVLPDCISQYIFLNIHSANIKIRSHISYIQSEHVQKNCTRNSRYVLIWKYHTHNVRCTLCETATFRLIYSCNLSGLGEPLQSYALYVHTTYAT